MFFILHIKNTQKTIHLGALEYRAKKPRPPGPMRGQGIKSTIRPPCTPLVHGGCTMFCFEPSPSGVARDRIVLRVSIKNGHFCYGAVQWSQSGKKRIFQVDLLKGYRCQRLGPSSGQSIIIKYKGQKSVVPLLLANGCADRSESGTVGQYLSPHSSLWGLFWLKRLSLPSVKRFRTPKNHEKI